jgi:hypothetical protein
MTKQVRALLSAGVALAMSATPVFAQVQQFEIKSSGLGVTDFGNLISAGIQTAIIVAAILTFAYLVWGGIQWITSGGDKAAYEAARGRITAALVGLAIVAAAWALMKLVGFFFGVDILGTINLPSAKTGVQEGALQPTQ